MTSTTISSKPGTRLRRRCYRCKATTVGGHAAVRRLTVRQVEHVFELCDDHGGALERDVFAWTRWVAGDFCVFCLMAPGTEVEPIVYGGSARDVKTCPPCATDFDTKLYAWTRDAVIEQRDGDLRVVAEKTGVVRDHKAVEPEKLDKPEWEDWRASQVSAEVAELAAIWKLTDHAIERIRKRGPGTAVETSFTEQDVLLAIKYGTPQESEAYALAKSMGLEGFFTGAGDETAAADTQFTSDKCVVHVDTRTKSIVTVWGAKKRMYRKGA